VIDDALAQRSAELGALLAARGRRIATAESCTGGLVAAAITATAGSSGWFDAGFVCYSNAMKVALLGVREDVLGVHGAVSEATARAMAEGALARSGADLAVAVTGIAGPGGAVPGKPVGTVCLAWAVRSGGTDASTQQFGGDRAAVRRSAALAALDGAIRRIRQSSTPAGVAAP
jgi:nicotinamide-nucleotide amidase